MANEFKVGQVYWDEIANTAYLIVGVKRVKSNIINKDITTIECYPSLTGFAFHDTFDEHSIIGERLRLMTDGEVTELLLSTEVNEKFLRKLKRFSP